MATTRQKSAYTGGYLRLARSTENTLNESTPLFDVFQRGRRDSQVHGMWEGGYFAEKGAIQYNRGYLGEEKEKGGGGGGGKYHPVQVQRLIRNSMNKGAILLSVSYRPSTPYPTKSRQKKGLGGKIAGLVSQKRPAKWIPEGRGGGARDPRDTNWTRVVNRKGG